MGLLSRAAHYFVGEPVSLPPDLAERYPELLGVRWRRGGIPPRAGGWGLGARTVAAITLWRTVWLAPHTPWSAELLLHELRHVHQFESSAWFPVSYLWESLRRGYHANRYELDACRYAAARLRGPVSPPPPADSTSWSSTPPHRS